MAQCAKHAGFKSKGEKRGSVTYSMDREDEVSIKDINFIFTVCLPGSEAICNSCEPASNF